MSALKVVGLAFVAWAAGIGGYAVIWSRSIESRGDLLSLIVWGAPVYVLFFALCVVLVALLRSRTRSWLICALACSGLGCVPLVAHAFTMVIDDRLPATEFVYVFLDVWTVAGLPGALFGAGLSLMWPELSPVAIRQESA